MRSRLTKNTEERDSREEATAGSRLWDKLLLSAGSVSKSITAKLKDDGYNSDSDEEGVDTHVIKALKDYYSQKGQGTPVWLGGSGSTTRPQASMGPPDTPGHARQPSHEASQVPAARSGKVSLKGIYEQAAERTSSQQQISPRRNLSRTGSAYPDQSDVYAPRRSEESSRSAGQGGAPSRQPNLSAGERFREKMKNNRSASSQSGMGLDSLSQQTSRTSRGSLEVPRDGASMANRLKRGGTTSSTNPNRF